MHTRLFIKKKEIGRYRFFMRKWTSNIIMQVPLMNSTYKINPVDIAVQSSTLAGLFLMIQLKGREQDSIG